MDGRNWGSGAFRASEATGGGGREESDRVGVLDAGRHLRGAGPDIPAPRDIEIERAQAQGEKAR